MAFRATGNRFAALASDGSHFADDPVVAFAFYNVGINEQELSGLRAKTSKKRSYRNPGSNWGPCACEAHVITNYTIATIASEKICLEKCYI